MSCPTTSSNACTGVTPPTTASNPTERGVTVAGQRRVRGLVRHRQPAPVRSRHAGHGRRARDPDAAALDAAAAIPVRVVVKPILTGPDGIRQLAHAANADDACVGLIAWMHTFSPAKMWIAGLDALRKPFLHLHTQYDREIPWSTIDMDFMNLNQAAHGDREFGFIAARMRLERKVVVGHWGDPDVQERIGAWTRAACARRDWETGRIARFGENMREVAATASSSTSSPRRSSAGLRSAPRLRWPGALTLELTSSCDHWVVYDEPSHAICVEPQMGPPDDVNLGPRTVLQPGDALEAWMHWRWWSPGQPAPSKVA